MSCFLDIVTSITGTCSPNPATATGAFSLSISGTGPYTLSWLNPSLPTESITGSTYSKTGLTAGTWSFSITDSCIPNGKQAVNVYISSGTCVSFSGITNTTCNEDNGSLTARTSSFYGIASFYLYETTLGYVTSANSATNTYVFEDLSPGIYYVVGNDGGGCTGQSETCIIKSSTTLNFGLYVVNDAGCAVDSGKIYVTGATGVPPYTYLWSNGETTSFITGLTAGNYYVTVTDSEGCSISSGATVNEIDPIGLGSFTSVSPSCFSSDGELTITVTGGTAPFYYSGSNGTTEISFSDTYTFSGLGGGYFGVEVTDAGLCKLNTGTNVLTPGGFAISLIRTGDSSCDNNTGRIAIFLNGGTPPYTYSLTGSSGEIYETVTDSPSHIFLGLSAGTYTLEISDGGPCVFTNTYIIESVDPYTLSVNTTGTTCGFSNGAVNLSVSTGGTGPYTYQINGASANSSLTSYTFTNLSSGVYTATVTDALGCIQIEPFTIPNISSLDFSLFGTDTIEGSDGVIQTFITEGEPPFTLNWSDNVNGQTTLTVTGLTAGTYTLTIIDDYGCTRTRTIEIGGTSKITSYQIYNICDTDFDNLGQLVKKGPFQMLNEGFYDLTSGDTNCILNKSTFIAQVEVSGVTASTVFWTGFDLGDVPGDNDWYDAVKELLLGFDIIAEVVVDEIENTILVISTCEATQIIVDTPVKITLKIEYNISCVSCT